MYFFLSVKLLQNENENNTTGLPFYSFDVEALLCVIQAFDSLIILITCYAPQGTGILAIPIHTTCSSGSFFTCLHSLVFCSSISQESRYFPLQHPYSIQHKRQTLLHMSIHQRSTSAFYYQVCISH